MQKSSGRREGLVTSSNSAREIFEVPGGGFLRLFPSFLMKDYTNFGETTPLGKDHGDFLRRVGVGTYHSEYEIFSRRISFRLKK